MLNNLNISSNSSQKLQLLKSQLLSALPAATAALSGGGQSTSSMQFSASQILNALSLSGTNQTQLNQKAIDILKRPPFAPTDVNLFSPQTYSSAPPLQPAAAKPLNEAQIRGQLTSTLAARLRNCNDIQAGLAVYNDPAIKSTVPDPRLRAALTSLKGTPGEASIESIKNGDFKEVGFKDLPDDIIALSQRPTTAGEKPSIFFNTRYQHEDFRLLAPILLHETLHSDSNSSGREERINTTLETMVYGQFALENPNLAKTGTELARRHNTRLMAVLNSRNSDGQLRPFTAQAGNVFPGGRPLNNFGDAFTTQSGQPLSDSSPGNATLQKVLKAVTGVNVQNAGFDAATDNVIDQNQIMFSPNKLVQLAKTLKLDIGN
jgi:hypothetical protein